MKVFSVCGYSKTGKTTTATNLIKLLKERQCRVAAIKDIHNEKFTMEKEGSNSHRMQQAGAETIFARGLKETYMIRPERMALKEMLGMLNTEWVVVEGMKKEALPKIVTAEKVEELAELVDDNVMAISGKIAEELTDYKGLPVINSVKNPEELVAIIVAKVFDVLPLVKKECCGECGLSCYDMVGAILTGKKTLADCALSKKQRIELQIAGKEIKMVPFVANIFSDMLIAFVRNLKGYQKGDIEIKLRV